MIDAGGASYSYDAAGNQRTRPGAVISYTAFDLPREVDPSGFQDEPSTPGVYERTDGNGNLEILVVGPPRAPPPPPPPRGPVEGPREATQVGDVRPPADMSVWGMIGGWTRGPPATLEEWLKPVSALRGRPDAPAGWPCPASPTSAPLAPTVPSPYGTPPRKFS